MFITTTLVANKQRSKV